ncbi:MAG: N-acetylmuramoyl-L-alanine amidase [Verrucomicrobiales bacterium]
MLLIHFQRLTYCLTAAVLFLAPLATDVHAAADKTTHDGRTYYSAQWIKNYFRFTGISTSKGRVILTSPKVRLAASSGSQTLYLNRVKFTMSYPLLSKGGTYYFSHVDAAKLIHPVLKPGNIRQATPFSTVIVDAGHGGHDSGSRGPYGVEKQYTLALAYKLKRQLQAKGFKVVLTRSGDSFLSLQQRVALANKYSNAIFVSLHFNWASSGGAGLETFALSPPDSSSTMGGYSSTQFSGNRLDAANIALATAVQAYSIKQLGGVDRGIKRARFAVLKGLKMPGVLFEGGFLSNRSEAKKIHSNLYLEKMAASLTTGIVKYRTETTSR